jgi:hypothetical protein
MPEEGQRRDDRDREIQRDKEFICFGQKRELKGRRKNNNKGIEKKEVSCAFLL